MELLHVALFWPLDKVPDFWLCARSPELSELLMWDLNLLANSCCRGVEGVDCHRLLWCFPLPSDVLFSSHALTVSLGVCQHLSSGEISLKVAACV